MVTLQQIRDVLMRIEYPATREEILTRAPALGATPEMMERLYTLDEHMYGSVDTVMDTLRGLA